MKNNLKLEFYKNKYGWWPFAIKNNNKLLNFISASYCYSPFNEYIVILKKLNKNYRGKIIFEIDQEGFDAILIFKIINNGKNILFTTYTDVNEKFRIERGRPKKSTTIFNRKQFIYEMKNNFIKSCIKNKKELKNDGWDSWYFDFRDLKKINNK